MKRRSHIGFPPRAVLFFLAALGSPLLAAQESDFDISGSIRNETGYIGLPAGLPAGAANDWFSTTSATLRLGRTNGPDRFYSQAWTGYDAAADNWEISLDEAWFELRRTDWLGLRMGRSRIQYGPCVAFNPANSLVAKDTFDDRAAKVGFDGAFVELRPSLPADGGRYDSWSLSINAAFLLPSSGTAVAKGAGAEASGTEDSTAHGRITLYLPGKGILGPTELGVSGDFRRLGRLSPEGRIPAATGFWLSGDIAGLVIGAEGTVRTAGYDALSNGGGLAEYGGAVSVNRKAGNFFALLEAQYESKSDRILGFARISRNVEDSDIAVSSLIDFASGAARSALEASWNASDFLVLGAEAVWNYRSGRWEGGLGADYAFGLNLECFF